MRYFLLFIFIMGCSSRSKVKNPFFYEATNGDRSIYILGTMHLGFKLSDFHPLILKKINESELVALEIDEKHIEEIKRIVHDRYLTYAKEKMFSPYETSKKLSPEAWKQLEFTLAMDDVTKTLKKYKIPHQISELNPSLVREIVIDLFKRQQVYAFSDHVKKRSWAWDARWLSHDLNNKVDFEILKYAREEKINVIALDQPTEDYLKSLIDFDNHSLEYLEMIFGASTFAFRNYQEMRQDYMTGNETGVILKSLNDEKSKDLFITERNDQWAKILKWRLEKRVFVGVGAAHLIGDKSLLKLLEHDGFQIKRIVLEVE